MNVLNVAAIDLRKGGKGHVYQGPPAKGSTADVELTISDDDLLLLGTGKLNGQKVSGVPLCFIANTAKQ